MHSKEKSAPPPVRSTSACTTLSRPTSSGLTKCVMPNFSAMARFAGLRSTPMILSAPTMRAPWITLRPMPPRPNTDDIGAGPDLRRVDHRADAGGDAAADVADLVERRVLAHLGERDLRQHREIGEGRAAHVVEHGVAVAARSGWCRRASRPCPASRGSRCRGSSAATGRFCTGGIRACRAGSRGRRA